MELSLSDGDDFLYWKYHPSGKYTVKTGYYYLSKDLGLDSATFLARDQEFIKLVWMLEIQPKWKLFLWKLFHDGIAVKGNLARRGIHAKIECDLCREEVEDSQHLFRFCIQAKEIWETSSLDVSPDSPGSISLKGWIQHYILLFYSKDGKQGTRCVGFIATLWGMWKARNARCFRGSTGTTSLVREFINLAIQDHESFTNRASLITEADTTSREEPILPPGFNYVHLGKEKAGFDDFIIEADGSWDKRTTRTRIGWAVKSNILGYGLDEGGKHEVAASVIQCEAWACLEAMKWAQSKGRHGILLVTDSLSLLNNLQDDEGR
ncbi:uncharacterized protein LOC110689853 [Chenopodium quinoa]|uniref:uncharacterized protein LOC110689853 n=1 Tax=Chenopodium quinoa TaxID=63459 RepID=UPI000B77372C|nr:uncharacterized protein LOC110689853 [Chenopodium quinoa]